MARTIKHRHMEAASGNADGAALIRQDSVSCHCHDGAKPPLTNPSNSVAAPPVGATAHSEFGDLVQMAAAFYQVPIALLSLGDSQQQQLTASVGMPATEWSRLAVFGQQVAQQAKPLIVRDALTDQRFATKSLTATIPAIRFYAGVPILSQAGSLLGTLGIIDYQPRSLRLADLHLLERLARQTTKLIDAQANACALFRMEAELQERARLTALGADVAVALGQSGELSDVLNCCLEAITQHLQVAFARIWTYDRETHLLELQAIAGQHSHTIEFGSAIPLGISIIGFIAQTLQPYLTNTVSHDMVIGAQEWVQQEGMVAFAGYPLVMAERLVGVLALFSRQPLSEVAQHMLASLANSMAVAIDRAWARRELVSSREALLFRLASEIRNSLDLDTVLGNAVNEIRDLLKIDRCHFLWCWVEPTHFILAATHEAKGEFLPSLLGEYHLEQAMPFGTAIFDQVMIRSNDVASDTALDPQMQQVLLNLGIMSQLLLPLETRSGQLGAIMCSHCSTLRSWNDGEVELLQAVVAQLSLAMDQAELYAQTRAAATAAQNQAHQLSEALQNLQQTQSQLIQSEKMSSLGQMVAGIAHEINNPVNFIAGNLVYAGNYINDVLSLVELYQQHYPHPCSAIQERADAIDMDFIAEDLPKLLSSMMMGAERIRQIVLSLRNFSRLDEAEMKPVDIHEGIENTLLILQSRLKATTQRVAIAVVKQYGNLPAVECYAGQLNQVFMNVLANAIDALDDQAELPSITITTEFVDHPDHTDPTMPSVSVTRTPLRIGTSAVPSVLVCIRDNGPGMTETVRTHLFDPFFTTKPVGKGTGLGLSISYQIVVDKHGGRLECVSEPGQGTEFQIQIPVRPQLGARRN